MGRFVILVLALSGLWLLLSGYFDEPLLLTLGALSVLFTAWLARRAGVMDEDGVPASVFPGIIFYLFWLAVEVAKANIAVARQALAVEPKLSPKMVVVPNPPQTTLGKAIFGNSITLTPGTVSIDLRKDEILVHALTEELSDIGAMQAMGERVARLEGRKS